MTKKRGSQKIQSDSLIGLKVIRCQNLAKMRRLCQIGEIVSLERERERFFGKNDPYLNGHNFRSIIDRDLINTAINRYSLDLLRNVILKCLVTFL